MAEAHNKRKASFPTLQAPPVDNQQGQRVLSRQIPTGTGRGQQSVGDNNIRIEYDNRRIVINDGERDRIIIGFDEAGF